MALLSGVAEIACRKCSQSFQIDAADIDLQQTGGEERQMGAEIFYSGSVELDCPKCRNNILVVYDASEYPVGVPNYYETTATGADIISGFSDIEIQFNEELYSFDQESSLYLPEEKKIITDLSDGTSHLLQELDRNPNAIYDVDPRKFEELIARIFSLHGFTVELTKRTRDGGRDVIAIRSDLGVRAKYIIECKRYAPTKRIGVGLVRALYGVQVAEGANKSILATTSTFTRGARDFASQRNITEWAMDLKDFSDIRGWVTTANAKSIKR